VHINVPTTFPDSTHSSNFVNLRWCWPVGVCLQNHLILQQTEHSFPNREAVGALLYLAFRTRPNFSYAVDQVKKHCRDPNTIHWEAVPKIFTYLNGTISFGIWLDGNLNGLKLTHLTGKKLNSMNHQILRRRLCWRHRWQELNVRQHIFLSRRVYHLV